MEVVMVLEHRMAAGLSSRALRQFFSFKTTEKHSCWVLFLHVLLDKGWKAEHLLVVLGYASVEDFLLGDTGCVLWKEMAMWKWSARVILQ